MSKETTKMPPVFKPSEEEQQARDKTYKHLQLMKDEKLKPRPHFAGQDGHRSWLRYLDDSERVLNGYYLSREAQGKEEWQANLMDNISLAKCKAIAAGVGLKVPDMEFDAVNDNGIRSLIRADLFKNITQQTFADGNASLHAFLEVWQLIAHGTIFTYEGYRTGGAKIRTVKSFDSRTGDIDVEEKYVKFDGKPFSAILNPQDFYWWDFNTRDVQDQKRVAWVQNYGRKDLEAEFSKYPNFKFIKDKSQVKSVEFDTLYYEKWKDHVAEEDEYEVVRMYDKEEDKYEVWVNGVPLIRAPLLWGGDDKIYPFAKQINQSFANSNFFVGMSWPGILESYQEHKNTTLNTLIDKTYRSMEPPMLVSLENRDLFDVESQMVNQDNRYYVPDINGVQPYPVQGVNQGELEMYNVLNQGIELISVDRSQQGVTGDTEKTARQALIEDARAQELKGSLFLALEDLWLQKTRLRNEIVLTHFLKDKAARKDKKGQIITVKNYTFGDGTRGTLDIHIAKNKNDLLTLDDIESREQAMEERGQAYKLISITKDYLNNYEYDYKIIPQSFHSQDRIASEEELMSEIQQIGTLDPAFLAGNKDLYIERILELHGRSKDQYNPPAQPPQLGEGQEGETPTGQGGGENNAPAEEEASLDDLLAQLENNA